MASVQTETCINLIALQIVRCIWLYVVRKTKRNEKKMQKTLI